MRNHRTVLAIGLALLLGVFAGRVMAAEIPFTGISIIDGEFGDSPIDPLTDGKCPPDVRWRTVPAAALRAPATTECGSLPRGICAAPSATPARVSEENEDALGALPVAQSSRQHALPPHAEACESPFRTPPLRQPRTPSLGITQFGERAQFTPPMLSTRPFEACHQRRVLPNQVILELLIEDLQSFPCFRHALQQRHRHLNGFTHAHYPLKNSLDPRATSARSQQRRPAPPIMETPS